jgi:hypothetical protein
MMATLSEIDEKSPNAKTVVPAGNWKTEYQMGGLR